RPPKGGSKDEGPPPPPGGGGGAGIPAYVPPTEEPEPEIEIKPKNVYHEEKKDSEPNETKNNFRKFESVKPNELTQREPKLTQREPEKPVENSRVEQNSKPEMKNESKPTIERNIDPSP